VVDIAMKAGDPLQFFAVSYFDVKRNIIMPLNMKKRQFKMSTGLKLTQESLKIRITQSLRNVLERRTVNIVEVKSDLIEHI